MTEGKQADRFAFFSSPRIRENVVSEFCQR